MRGRLGTGLCLCLLFSLFIDGCDVSIPEGVFACSNDEQCPEGFSCSSDRFCGETAGAAGFGGGGSGGGQGGGTSGNPKLRDCMIQVPATLANLCKVCLCERCPEQTMACDSDCWSLIVCAFNRCTGKDPACISSNCSMQYDARQVQGVIGCSDECTHTCSQ